MQYVKAFIAGFLATVVFHQSLLALLHAAGVVPVGGWNMTAVPPLGIPSVLSLSFWGGLWGIFLWLIIRKLAGAKYWLVAMLVGALAASAVALLVVLPTKGVPVTGNVVVGAALLNGTWGFGVAVFMRLMKNFP